MQGSDSDQSCVQRMPCYLYYMYNIKLILKYNIKFILYNIYIYII